MVDLNRLEPLEKEWEEIELSYRIPPYIAPTNREEERQKVFAAYRKGQFYNPQFVYAEPPQYPVPRIREFMTKLRPDQSPLEMLYYEKACHELLTIQSVQTHAPEIITASTCLAHGIPNNVLLSEAWRILREIPPERTSEPENISAEQAAGWMQSVFEKNSVCSKGEQRGFFQDWKAVVFEPMNAGMTVNRLDKEVRIRKGTTYSQSALRRLIVHEIGVHVLRYENGVRQPIRLFCNSFPGYSATEEGLAVYSETHANMVQARTLRRYAGRVIAANLALSLSFSEVFQNLAEKLGEDEAFDITVRAKRGFTDTSQPGSHVKDHAYLKGYLAVKTHLEQHLEDYPLLFVGKFGLQHLPLVRSLLTKGIISLPVLLPDDLKE